MKGNTQTPPAPEPESNNTGTVIESDPMKAFDAGLRSAQPKVTLSGLISRHKDIVIDDHSKSMIRRQKASESGPFNPAATITVATAESLIVLWFAHSDSRSRIFADPDKSVIRLVFDHLSNGKCDSADDLPAMGWSQHTASLTLRESRKLALWKRLNEWHGQVEFANFLEDNLEDVMTPAGSELLAIATDLEANATGSFRGRTNLSNGSVQLSYQSDTITTVEVPAKLTLAIPLFEHGDRYKLAARLHFRVTSSGVSFRVLLTNLAESIDSEFERIAQEIEEKTGKPIIRGAITTPWESVNPCQ